MPIGLWFTLTPLRTHTAPLRDTLPHPVKGESETEQWQHRNKPVNRLSDRCCSLISVGGWRSRMRPCKDVSRHIHSAPDSERDVRDRFRHPDSEAPPDSRAADRAVETAVTSIRERIERLRAKGASSDALAPVA